MDKTILTKFSSFVQFSHFLVLKSSLKIWLYGCLNDAPWRDKRSSKWDFFTKFSQNTPNEAFFDPTFWYWRQSALELLKGLKLGMGRFSSTLSLFWENGHVEPHLYIGEIFDVQIPRPISDVKKSIPYFCPNHPTKVQIPQLFMRENWLGDLDLSGGKWTWGEWTGGV